MRRRPARRIVVGACVWALSLLVLVPFFLVLVNSLKDRAGANVMGLALPTVFHWENYAVVVREGKLLRSFLNSLLVASASTVVSVAVSALAAFTLSRRRTRANRFLYGFFLLGLAAPLNMITVIRSLQAFSLMNTYLGIILLYGALLIPFSVFLYYGFVSSVPREMDESAMMDGCRPLDGFLRVVFPLMQPVTFTVAVINFMNAWNEFMIPLYVLNNSDRWPMTLAIYNFYGRRVSDWNLVFADILLTILPVLGVYMVGQRYLVSGMTAGAVKG
jgi:raffinose/stachyose/melibiose transport system permease protein